MPVKSFQKRKNISNVKRKEEENQSKEASGNDFEEHYQVLIKPPDQLVLTEEELKEEITKVLKATNPAAPDNIVRYSFKERQYKPVANIDQTMFHFSMYNNLVEKDSLEAFDINKGTVAFEDSTSVQNLNEEHDLELPILDHENTTIPSRSSTMLHYDAEPSQNEFDKIRSSNRFLFCNRGTQTINNPYQSKETQSEHPPRKVFSEYVNQAIIYDCYEKDFQIQSTKHKRTLTNFGGSKLRLMQKQRTIPIVHETHFDDITSIMPVIKILERMLNLNTFDEIASDFRYYNDPADEYRTDNQGTLLPLWKFTYEKAKKSSITALVWSPLYKDLFFVGFGNYCISSFEEEGTICGFSLKNPGFPEYTCSTKSPVVTLDIHPTDCKLICAGLIDGGVIVLSLIQNKSDLKPFITHDSNLHNNKHRDPCWQVKWITTDRDNVLSFLSVSGDGRVSQWTINKYELSCEDLFILSHDDISKEITYLSEKYLESGSCLALHPTRHNTFLVGTQEGHIYFRVIMQSSGPGSSAYHIFNKTVHSLIIYRIAWSPWHPDIFASCSADWTVRIWNYLRSDPIISFDLGSPVSDFAWAPYSSTVFATVTSDRKVRVYDIAINKQEPLVYQIVGSDKRKAPLTQICFNDVYPILLVGDTRGNIYSMKLSPNLRKCPKIKKNEVVDIQDYQYNKLDKIIQLLS